MYNSVGRALGRSFLVLDTFKMTRDRASYGFNQIRFLLNESMKKIEFFSEKNLLFLVVWSNLMRKWSLL